MTLPEEPPNEVSELEQAAVTAVTGALAHGLARFIGPVLAAWDALRAGGRPLPAVSAFKAAMIKRLREVTWTSMDGPVRTYEARASAIGVRRAVDTLPEAERPERIRVPQPPAPGLDRLVHERLREAEKLARDLPMRTKANVMAVVGKAGSARGLAEGKVRERVYTGLSLGTVMVARDAGRNLIWVPERDACLDCLALAGWVVAPGQEWPRVTYGDKLPTWRVQHPPLHPNCRCELRMTALEPGPPSRDRSQVDEAARLAAEARRSVVLGWTDNESQAATLRAMDRLLAQGADLPVSVEQRARRALAAGQRARRPKK